MTKPFMVFEVETLDRVTKEILGERIQEIYGVEVEEIVAIDDEDYTFVGDAPAFNIEPNAIATVMPQQAGYVIDNVYLLRVKE